MVEIVISVAAKVAEYLVDPIIRPLGYLFNYHRNITDLNQQIENLHRAREELQIPVNEANRQGDEMRPGVRDWLTYAEGIILKRNDFNEHERKASKSCFYLKSRYQLSKQAKKQAAEIVDKIQEAHNFGGRVAHRLPPPPPPFITSAYEAFPSRESTFNQIMEALRNEDMRMIGVWGMGGAGKTTLVNQVAQQEKENKLFHEVVMASNISQTPNIAEIQEKIARMLDLKFEAGEDRAGRLKQRLKREEKILVILDDIWGKLDLGEIGIPYGDDHKGCKVLLTSRERQVLSKDMRTQKEFHLQHLSEDEAWNLFKKTAVDSVENPELPPIAVDVAKKCDGLPVAIVTIAKALRGESVHVWENALEELRRAAPTNIRGVSKEVYSCLELSYKHLEGDEVKSLFLLCALLGDGDISMGRLLQHAMGLNLFEGFHSWTKATNKLITLVQNLKASSLLLEGEDGDNHRYSSLCFDENENTFVRMHDVVRDVARSIASKVPHRFVVREAVGSQEAVELLGWQKTDEYRNCTRISLICRNMDELPQDLVCPPQLEFFLLNSSNDDPYLKIPDAFFQDTNQLRILDLSKVSLTLSPSSLGFLSNLQTLRLNQCQIQDITVVGELKKLQVLSLAESNIEQLPNDLGELNDTKHVVYDLDKEGFVELKYLSLWQCPTVQYILHSSTSVEWVPPPNTFRMLEELFLSSLHNLEAVCHGPIPTGSFGNLRILRLWGCKRLKYVFSLPAQHGRESAFPQLQHLKMSDLPSLISFYSTRSSGTQESMTFFSQQAAFPALESLHVFGLNNVKALWHNQLPANSFSKLKGLKLYGCDELLNVFPLSVAKVLVQLEDLQIYWCVVLEAIVANENEDEATSLFLFPRLTSLSLLGLSQLQRFCFGRFTSRWPLLKELEVQTCDKVEILFQEIGLKSELDNKIQQPLFLVEKAAFPALESLRVIRLNNLKALWHNQLPANSFSKLKGLVLSGCNELLNVFPLSVAKVLVQLEDLQIDSCKVLEAIVANANEDEATSLFLFPRLTSLTLYALPQLQGFCFGRFTSRWPLLKELEVRACDKVEILFQEIGLKSELDNKIQQSLFLVEKEAFPNLEELSLSLKGTVEIWRGQFSRVSFLKLSYLKIEECQGISVVIPSNMVQILHNLEKLEVRMCDSVNEVIQVEIVGNDGHELTDNEIEFTRLESLTLHHLPNLKSFCSSTRYVFKFPSLETMKVGECHGMEFFCKGVLDAPRLKSVEDEFFQRILAR